MRLISALLHLCFACVPGCGQMYQGYMKRGISQTVLFSISIFFAILLENGALAVLIIPLWAYSFFDSFNLRRQWKDGYAVEDEYMFGLSDLDSDRLTRLLGKRHSLIGWILVVVGLFNLYQIFARNILGALRDFMPWFDWLYHLLVWDAPRIMGTVLIIAAGMWFVRWPKTRQGEDDFPHSFSKPSKPQTPPERKPSPWTKAEETFHEEPEPKAPDIPEVPEPVEWESEFDVEKYEKEAENNETPPKTGE